MTIAEVMTSQAACLFYGAIAPVLAGWLKAKLTKRPKVTWARYQDEVHRRISAENENAVRRASDREVRNRMAWHDKQIQGMNAVKKNMMDCTGE